jgi:hypothetical protein
MYAHPQAFRERLDQKLSSLAYLTTMFGFFVVDVLPKKKYNNSTAVLSWNDLCEV